MAIRDALLPEFDQEMASTRNTLARVPADKLEWRPHDKSFTMQQLAAHIANVPVWTEMTLDHESLDVAPADGEQWKTPQPDSVDHLLKMFDENVAAAREVIAKADDEKFMLNWTLLAGGKEIFTLPRAAVLRSFIFSHIIHHRAQLGLYLRLTDVPVPAVYGPSADEEGM